MPWSGKATYDNFALIGEDVSPIVLLMSPRETPFLDLLPDADQPATSIDHQWTEEALGPDRIVASTAIPGSLSQTGVMINGFGNMLQVGMLLEVGTSGEIAQISSIPGPNSLALTRNFGSRGLGSLSAGGELFVISTAELEGSETSGDVNRPRTRRRNWTQIFKKPVTITGTDRAVLHRPDLGDEFDHQTTLRTIELMRDLEKAVFRSVASGSSIGSATSYRTFDGLRQWLTSINSTISTNSFTADPLTYTNDLLQQAWTAGARDIDVIVAGAAWKRALSATNAARVQLAQADTNIIQLKEFIQTDFGSARLVLSPWLPDNVIMGVSTRRVRVVPLRGRSFQRETLAKTGDSFKGHVIGEYTIEVHHPDKMFQARGV
jgi:hypothetical protein